MRRAFAAAAALALAGCQVDVEGARCTVPGSLTECPDGQACGNDLKCSRRAAACAAAATRCDLQASRCASGSVAETCVANVDPACGSWQAQACGTNKTCVTRGPSGACECDANGGTELAADPLLGSAPGAAPRPTGLATPSDCRFRKLGDALAVAAARGGVTTVKAYGAPGAPVTFTGEAFPLVVPPDVTVAGADAPAGVTILQGDAATSATMVTLQGTLQGVQLQNLSMTANGADLTCGATGMPVLRDVVIASAGAQKLASGVTIAGACGALLERVDVSGAAGAALFVDVPSGAPITVGGSRLHGSGVGIDAIGGRLKLQPDPTTGAATEATDNTGYGVYLRGATKVEATLTGVLVARNGGTGLVINSVPTTSTLTMTSCDVHSNGTGAPRPYGPVMSTRTAGGILVSQLALAVFQLKGNRVYANHGGGSADELAFESSGPWKLSTGFCDATTNLFGCAGGGYAVSTTGGAIDAQFTTWPISPPTATVNGSVDTSSYCGFWSTACP